MPAGMARFSYILFRNRTAPRFSDEHSRPDQLIGAFEFEDSRSTTPERSVAPNEIVLAAEADLSVSCSSNAVQAHPFRSYGHISTRSGHLILQALKLAAELFHGNHSRSPIEIFVYRINLMHVH